MLLSLPTRDYRTDLTAIRLLLRDMLEPEAILLYPGSFGLHRSEEWPPEAVDFFECTSSIHVHDELLQVGPPLAVLVA